MSFVMRVYKDYGLTEKLLNHFTAMRCGLKSFKRQIRQFHISEEQKTVILFVTKMQKTVSFLEKQVQQFKVGVDATLHTQKSTQFAKKLLKLRRYCAILESAVMDLSCHHDYDKYIAEMTYMQKTAKLNVRIQHIAKLCHMTYILK